MINTGLFPIDEKFLLAISRLEDENNPNFQIIRDKISEVSILIDQQSLYSFPDFRLNYGERSNVLKGFCIAMDLLKNIFNNPNQLLSELKEQDEFIEAQEKARGEGLVE